MLWESGGILVCLANRKAELGLLALGDCEASGVTLEPSAPDSVARAATAAPAWPDWASRLTRIQKDGFMIRYGG